HHPDALSRGTRAAHRPLRRGLGVGLVVSAGTAWAARLNGAAGSTLAGIVLTSGFALGPVISGLTEFAFSPLWLPFVLSIIASLVAVVFSLRDRKSVG